MFRRLGHISVSVDFQGLGSVTVKGFAAPRLGWCFSTDVQCSICQNVFHWAKQAKGN
jgi:hypothetical protein